MNLALLTELLSSTIRITTPIMLMALGGMLCERTNVFNIALEGMALVGAFFAVAFVSFTGGSVWMGLLGGILAGCIYSALFALVITRFRANHIIASIALNTLASGLTQFLLRAMFDSQGTYAPPVINKLSNINLPLIKDVPLLKALSGHSIVTYASILLVAALYIYLYKTRAGLRHWSVGESEDAAKTAGVNINRTKWKAVLCSGALCGLGGAYLSVISVSNFTKGMIAGRGFTAFTAYTFGGATPVGSALASLLFGFAEALGIRIELLGLKIPASIVDMFPYALALIALAYSSWSRGRRVAGLKAPRPAKKAKLST